MNRMTTKEEKFFQSNIWYHGTTLSGWKSICQLGIQAQFNIGISVDFGNGFYLSNNLVNTKKYVENITKYTDSEDESDLTPVIIEFTFSPLEWILQGASYKYFAKYDQEFAEFVFENRVNYNEKKKLLMK